MALASAQVIDAVAVLIRTVTGMSGKVHTSRAWPLAEGDIPAWRVVGADEEVETLGVGFPAQQQHDLEVDAHGYAHATADLDDTLHAMAAAALTKLFASSASAALSPLRCVLTLRGMSRAMVEEGQAAMGRITLHLRVRFLTFQNAPETIL